MLLWTRDTSALLLVIIHRPRNGRFVALALFCSAVAEQYGGNRARSLYSSYSVHLLRSEIEHTVHCVRDRIHNMVEMSRYVNRSRLPEDS